MFWKHGIIFLIAIFGNLATKILPFRLPWAMDAAFVGVGLYHVGYLLKQKTDLKLLNIKFTNFFILAILVVILIFLNTPVNMRIGNYGNILLFWITSILASILIINISKWIEKSPKLLINKIKKILKYIGKNSIVYLLLNQFVLLAIYQITKRVFIDNNIYVFLIVKLLTLILCLFVLYLLTELINKTKLKIFIGKEIDN